MSKGDSHGLRGSPVITMLAMLALALTPMALGQQVIYQATVTVDCDGVPHVEIIANVTPGLIRLDAPVDVYEGTLEASVDNVAVPALLENGSIIVAVDSEGVLRIRYVGVTELTGEGDLMFTIRDSNVEVIIGNCTLLTAIPQNLLEAEATDGNTIKLRLAGPEVVRYIPIQTKIGGTGEEPATITGPQTQTDSQAVEETSPTQTVKTTEPKTTTPLQPGYESETKVTTGTPLKETGATVEPTSSEDKRPGTGAPTEPTTATASPGTATGSISIPSASESTSTPGEAKGAPLPVFAVVAIIVGVMAGIAVFARKK